MSHLLSRLAAVCGEQLLREKILVVPSLAIGHQIADAIAHGGTPWVNLRVETVRTLSDAVAGFGLAHEGVTVLSRAQALAMVERACDRELDESSYFAALADRPGLHRAIQKSIDDLRHAGIDPSRMTPSAFEDPRKAGDLRRILAAYEEEIARGRYVDRYGVLARATAMLEEGTAGPWSSDAAWFVVDELELTRAEERFLRAAAGNFELISSAESDGLLGHCQFRRAMGEENELRGVFRQLLGARSPFDDAEIAYTTRDPYLPLANEMVSEYGIPCTFAEGVASHYTRPGQACLAFLRWMGEGWHAVHLQRAARRGTFATPSFGRLLRKAAIGWGRDRYLPRIDALLADPGIREQTNADAREARTIMESLLAITEDVAEGEAIDVAAAARAASTFVLKFATVRNETDAMAREGLQRMLNELSAVGAGTEAPSRAEVASRLADAVRNLHVAASNPRPGYLHVAPLRAAGWSARSQLFVVGMDESKHPGSGLQDPVLLDVEREAIGIPVIGDRPQRVSAQFHRLLARASSRKITLSYASTILKDRRDRFPSSDLLDIYRSTSGQRGATYQQAADAITLEGFVNETALTDSDWWMRRRFTGNDPDLAAAIHASYPALDAGAEAEEARDSESITRWDGLVNAPREEVDPRLNGVIYSASQLEKMAGCPFRFFLERILRVKPLEDLIFDPDSWLEARQFGTLLHEVFESGMNEICAAGLKPSLSFFPRLEVLATEALQRYRAEVPPPSESAYERRRDDLLAACEIFLKTEEEACRTVTPQQFEVSFGSDESEGIAMPEPFSLSLGRGEFVKLRGRIDRVDRDDASGEWHVWDYKSGGTWDFDRGGLLRRGMRIQHAVYSRAVAAMLERAGILGTVTCSGYLFPTKKGGGLRLKKDCSDRELNDALTLLFDVVGGGFFPHSEPDSCKFCDFQAVCGGSEAAALRTRRKLSAQPTDPRVMAWLKLQEVR